ncbi:MAG: hypothetical protein AAGF24_07550, partial [Cyanobacteria bacterium P01_H01_bin.121]
DIIPPFSKKTFIFVADEQTFSDPEQSLLVLDLFQDRGSTFRVIPKEVANVESNLAIANMDWEDFSLKTDADGVFRGFAR